MNYWQWMLLGIIQGLTEFLPISSTAHLRIVPAFLGWPDPGAALSAVLQLGTLAAVMWYFRRDVLLLTFAAWRSIWHPPERANPNARMAWHIAAGNLPIMLLGLWGRNWIEGDARSLPLIGVMLIVVALALAWVECRPAGKFNSLQLNFPRTILIGFFQALALIPGASRSGSTLLGGMLVGLTRTEAARFAFLLGIPAILGSGLLQLLQVWQAFQDKPLPLLTALLVTAISGHLTIGWLLAYLQKHSTQLFVFYRLGLGILVLVFWRQWLH